MGKKKNSLLLLPSHFWRRDDDYDDDDHHSLLLREIHYFLQLQTCRVIDDCLDLASGWDCSSSSSSFEVQGLVFLQQSSPSWTKYWVLALASDSAAISANNRVLTVHSSLPLTTEAEDLSLILPRGAAGKHCVTLALELPCIQDWGIYIPSPIKYVRRNDYNVIVVRTTWQAIKYRRVVGTST